MLVGIAPMARYRDGRQYVKARLFLGHPDKRSEALDAAARAHPVADGFALGANALVIRLKVEAVIKVQCRALAVHFCPYPGAITKQEVDGGGSRQYRAGNAIGRNAFGPLFLLPFEPSQRAWPNGNSKDDLVLYDDAAHDRLMLRLSSQRKHGWDQAEEGQEDHA